MDTIKFLIQKPISVFMSALAIALVSFFVLQNLPITPLPDISLSEITVHLYKNNTSAGEFEKSIVGTIRNQLRQITDLENLTSETTDNYSIIHLKFKYNTGSDIAFLNVNEKIDKIMPSLPRDLERPKVIKRSISDIPLFYINVKLRGGINSLQNDQKYYELCNYANTVIKRRLEQLPEIAVADITGLKYSEIYIKLYDSICVPLGINRNLFQECIEQSQLSVALNGIKVREGISEYLIRFNTDKITTVEELKNLSIKTGTRIFKLSQLAEVGIRPQESKGFFLINNAEAINLAIIKQYDSKLQNLEDKTEKLIIELQKYNPEVEITKVQDQTSLLNNSMSNLKQDLLFGSILAFVILFVFIKDINAPVIVVFTVPFALLLSLLFFGIFKLSLNIVSLAGLALGVGLMIDNSIIAIENITQKLNKGYSIYDSCSAGVTEIIRPLLASAFTTCSVFVPLIFLGGIGGALFYDQALAVSIGVFSSFLVTVFLLPPIFAKLYGFKKNNRLKSSEENKVYIFFEKKYKKLFHWTFRHKKISFAIVVLLVLCNILIVRNLKKEQLPSFNSAEFQLKIDWNSNIDILENKNRIIEMLTSIDPQKKILINSEVGQQDYMLNFDKQISTSESRVYFKTSHCDSVLPVENLIHNFLVNKYPTASYELSPVKNIFEKVFSSDSRQLVINVSNLKNPELPLSIDRSRDMSVKINKWIEKSPVNIPLEKIMYIDLDMKKMIQYELNSSQVISALKLAVGSNKLTLEQIGKLGNSIMISNTNNNEIRRALKYSFVKNKTDAEIPLSAIVHISFDENYKTIYGGLNGNYLPLIINAPNPGMIMDSVSKLSAVENNLQFDYEGDFIEKPKILIRLFWVFMASILLLYFILAIQFESFLQPLIVLSEIPISMCGSLLMLYLFNSSINLMSLIGLIVMCGIIINDSILKIDTVNNLIRVHKFSIMEALSVGGKMRLKSILMTCLTTVLSVTPFLFGNDLGATMQKPLSLVLIGGLIVGTFVSLFFIPLMYWLCYQKK